MHHLLPAGPASPRRSRRAILLPAAALLALAALLVLADPASARAPVLLTAGQSSRHITATWELPPGVQAVFVEVSTRPATSSDGAFVDTADSDLLDSAQTTWTGSEALPPGTYYVHVAGFEPECDTCPTEEWSNILTVTIPRPVPEPGTYAGKTEFPDSKRITFALSNDLARITHLRIAFTLDCTYHGFPVGRFRARKLDIGGAAVQTDGSFARLVRARLRGGGSLSMTVRGRLRPPRRATGTLRAVAKLPGGIRCRNFFGTVSWTARHG